MTNTEVYQGFNDDKKVEEHCSKTLGWKIRAIQALIQTC